MPSHPLDPELAHLKRLQSHLASAVNKAVWARELQRRATRISALVRRLPSLVRVAGAERSRTESGWVVSLVDDEGVCQAVLEVVTDSPARRAAELSAPLPMRVLLPDLVNLAELAQLASSGAVLLVYPRAA
jgi:hypothetical protein